MTRHTLFLAAALAIILPAFARADELPITWARPGCIFEVLRVDMPGNDPERPSVALLPQGGWHSRQIGAMQSVADPGTPAGWVIAHALSEDMRSGWHHDGGGNPCPGGTQSTILPEGVSIPGPTCPNTLFVVTSAPGAAHPGWLMFSTARHGWIVTSTDTLLEMNATEPGSVRQRLAVAALRTSLETQPILFAGNAARPCV